MLYLLSWIKMLIFSNYRITFILYRIHILEIKYISFIRQKVYPIDHGWTGKIYTVWGFTWRFLWLCEELSGGYLELVWLWRIKWWLLTRDDGVVMVVYLFYYMRNFKKISFGLFVLILQNQLSSPYFISAH